MTSFSRDWCVAATTRTSIGIDSDPPTRSNFRSWSTRNNLTCMDSGTSPISSKKRVPPLAISNRPLRCAAAPVNDPFSWPNSSLSSSDSGNAAQLIAVNTPDRNGFEAV